MMSFGAAIDTAVQDRRRCAFAHSCAASRPPPQENQKGAASISSVFAFDLVFFEVTHC